jgi:RimJ/RimL family protein N-acetyltransferase
MFPDLTCDDVFRFETKRLWLRWPRATDAAAIAEFAADPGVAQMIADMPQAYPPQEAERFILKARAENAAGCALHLAVTQKTTAGAVIGMTSAIAGSGQDVEIGYVLARQVWGKGLATEAVRALVDMIFSLTPAARIFASARVVNNASRRVLEKSVFAPVETGSDLLAMRDEAHCSDRFRLDRTAWQRSNALRRMPPMAQQRRDGVGLETADATAEVLTATFRATPQC